MSDPGTLKEALLEERFEQEGLIGYKDQIDVLTDEAKNLTYDEVIEILNSESHDLSAETMESLRKLARIRIKNGQLLLPWKKFASLSIERSGLKKGEKGW